MAEELPREAQLLLRLARPAMTAADVEACRDLLEDDRYDTDWGRFVDLAGRNKILPLVGYNLTRHQLLHKRNGALEMPYHYLFTSVYLANRQRNEAMTEEFARVLEQLERSTVRYAVRKGPVVLDAVYPDLGTRRMTDLDLLVHADDVAAVLGALQESGYGQGRVSADGRSVEPFSRRTQLFWRMNLSNELPAIRLAGREDLTAYTIDVCRDMLPRDTGREVRTPEILGRAVLGEFCGMQGRRLAPEDHLLDLCVHLFKEATTLYYIENQADLQLQKFVDVAGSLPSLDDADLWERLLARTQEYGVESGVYFALYYTDVLFPGTVRVDVLDRSRPADLGYLDEYGSPDGATATWNRPFVHRLFSTGRRREVTVSSEVPRT